MIARVLECGLCVRSERRLLTKHPLRPCGEGSQPGTPLAPPPAYPLAIRPLTSHQSPTVIYNGMIHPLIPFGIRGVIWYQGESNHREGMSYYHKMHALVGGWRKLWQQGDFPFYYVQIAPKVHPGEAPDVIPAFWEAQNRALDIPNTGQAVIHDIGNIHDVHPRNKQGVGARLALIALAKTYGRPNVVYSGPTFKSLKVEGTKLRVTFDHVGGGLVSRDGKPLTWFEIIGKDTGYVPATAEIDGDSVVLSSPKVKQAAAMRFGWSHRAMPNLFNKEGLPAAPFRAGEIPKRDWSGLLAKELKQYKLVYDLDLANLGKEVRYTTDASKSVTGAFDRIAYFLELQKSGGPASFVFVSMDAFTDDVAKIGVPTVASKASFQKRVANLNVFSSEAAITKGEGLAGGNIEFWPNKYSPHNVGKVPGASNAAFDFGDRMGPLDGGYGCMQVHNHQARQTLFAINNWQAGRRADIGIGSSPGKTRDWSFAANAASYATKRLRVYVRPK